MPNNLPEPIPRKEKFLASAAGMAVETPTPITREEIYLDAIAKGGGSGDAYTKAQTDALLDGKADLVDGKVPAAQLPSYVDDVAEYASTATFPATGESGKIYIAQDTNKTYRWSGSGYTEISESLALGETASTAYAGNKGKANADAIAAIKDGTNIDSFADVETALAAKLNTADVDVDLSSTSTNPVQNKAIQAPLAMLIDNGVKNLLNLRDPSAMSTGIAVVNNYDGTYSITANVDVVSNVLFNISFEKGGWFILSGCPSGGGDSSYALRVNNMNGSAIAKSVDLGNGSDEFQLNAGDYQLVVRFAPGTYSNIVFKPMLCTAEDWAVSHKFAPYAPTNRELYEMILALQNAQNGG